MIHIENKKKYRGTGFYVGRPSPLGNPFPVDAKTSRSQAIEKYREWFGEQLKSVNPTSKAFKILVDFYRAEKEMTLICWCVPFQCHAEVIRDFVLKEVGENANEESKSE